MKKIALVAIAMVLVLVVSGCMQQATVCGNGACEQGETAENCTADCAGVGEPPMPPTNEGGEEPPDLPF